MPADPSRRERRKQELRERILTAARTLFEERGYTATTVAEIADAADVASSSMSKPRANPARDGGARETDPAFKRARIRTVPPLNMVRRVHERGAE